MPDNKFTGRLGEDLAAKHLEEQGYTVLARNWRAGRAEVDLIACRGNTVHFVEVKTRRGRATVLPELRVNAAKIDQMRLVAQAWLEQHPQWFFIQFDILAIRFSTGGWPEILLIEDIA